METSAERDRVPREGPSFIGQPWQSLQQTLQRPTQGSSCSAAQVCGLSDPSIVQRHPPFGSPPVGQFCLLEPLQAKRLCSSSSRLFCSSACAVPRIAGKLARRTLDEEAQEVHAIPNYPKPYHIVIFGPHSKLAV